MCLLYELLPEEFRKHRQAAKRERLLSWRALVDAALERLDESPAGATEQTTGATPAGDFWAHRRAARREEMRAIRSLFDGCMLGFLSGLGGPAPAEAPTRIEIV